jgi:hypothetical protein
MLRREQFAGSLAVFATGAIALTIVMGPAFPQAPIDRRDVKPMALAPVPPARHGLDAAGARAAAAAPIRLLRHVEGLDSAPALFDDGEVTRQLGDPFGKLLAGAGARLPRTLADVLQLVDTLGTGPDGLAVQTIFIVSETGQITLAEAPTLARRARAVVVRLNPTAREAVFVAPSMRTDGDGVLEVMGWDGTKRLFNYYERRFAEPDTPIWLWKGDSSHAWDARTRNGACFRCHRNGEPVMKELRDPWQNWHAQSASIKPESIPADSPLKTDPLFSIHPPSQFLRTADQFEKVVEQWIGNLNRSRIARYKAGELSVRNVLEPLFRTTTINLKPSIDPSAGTDGAVRIPWTFFYNTIALTDVGELLCDASTAFGQPDPSLSRSAYNDALVRLNFRLEGPGGYRKQPGDTHFAFPVLEPARTDTDLIFNLVKEQVISRRFAASLLMVDAPNAVYSPIRQGMFSLVPDWTIREIGPAGLDAQLADLFRDLHASGGQPAPVHAGLSQFLALWGKPAASWEADACARLERYLKNVGERWRTGDHLPYFRLLGARRDQFLASDHETLKESDLLLPKSDANPDLTMHEDGTVRP